MLDKFKTTFDNKNFNLHLKEINKRNYNGLSAFTLTGFFISMLMILMEFIFFDHIHYKLEILALLVYFILLYIISKYILKKHIKHIIAISYLAVTPLMFVGIMLGTFLDKNNPAITIIIFICVLTTFILDKPWRILIYLTTISIIFLICCYNAKSLYLFRRDFINLVMYYPIAIGVNIFSLHDRFNCVYDHVKYK